MAHKKPVVMESYRSTSLPPVLTPYFCINLCFLTGNWGTEPSEAIGSESFAAQH